MTRGPSEAVRTLNDEGTRGSEAVGMTVLPDGRVAVLCKRALRSIDNDGSAGRAVPRHNGDDGLGTEVSGGGVLRSRRPLRQTAPVYSATVPSPQDRWDPLTDALGNGRVSGSGAMRRPRCRAAKRRVCE